VQFPVPQFTDVEDKIIGPLSIKQFGIVFSAGIIVVLAFSATKSVLVGVFFGVLLGLPALGIAFGKINGRPVYNSFGHMLKFWTGPKFLVFHKEISSKGDSAKVKNAQMSTQAQNAPGAPAPQDPKIRLKEVNRLLEQQAQAEKELLNKQ